MEIQTHQNVLFVFTFGKQLIYLLIDQIEKKFAIEIKGVLSNSVVSTDYGHPMKA